MCAKVEEQQRIQGSWVCEVVYYSYPQVSAFEQKIINFESALHTIATECKI